jgi:glycosyltransferase involved in cell wall biosynthesis
MPFVPVRLGPADWVDADVFDAPPNASKRYDLVMVANWAPHKRHALLFRALREVRDRDLRVLLIGFPWANRTADDIRREATELLPKRVKLEIVEKIPHVQLARLLRQCKVFVFLSKKEGDNKALVEAMFADVPAIVYDRTIGGASSRVNAATGIFASEQELPSKIRYMLDHHAEFAPRRWALEHTGSIVATKILDDSLRNVATAAGGVYSSSIVEKTNAPNLAYKNPSDRARFQVDYDFILSCRLPIDMR